jgi:hypothetical protein
MSTKLVEVACFSFPTEPGFLLFTSILEAEGIPFACPERLQIEMQPFMSLGLGGLRVLVHDYNAEKARLLLENIQSSEMEEQEEEENNEPVTERFEAKGHQEVSYTNKAETYVDDDQQAQRTWDNVRFGLVLLLVGYLIYTFVFGF